MEHYNKKLPPPPPRRAGASSSSQDELFNSGVRVVVQANCHQRDLPFAHRDLYPTVGLLNQQLPLQLL